MPNFASMSISEIEKDLAQKVKAAQGTEAPTTIDVGGEDYMWDSDRGQWTKIEPGNGQTDTTSISWNNVESNFKKGYWKETMNSMTDEQIQNNKNRLARLYAKSELEKNPDIDEGALSGDIRDKFESYGGINESEISDAVESAGFGALDNSDYKTTAEDLMARELNKSFWRNKRWELANAKEAAKERIRTLTNADGEYVADDVTYKADRLIEQIENYGINEENAKKIRKLKSAQGE